MAKNIAVYGIYPNHSMVEKAVEELLPRRINI